MKVHRSKVRVLGGKFWYYSLAGLLLVEEKIFLPLTGLVR